MMKADEEVIRWLLFDSEVSGNQVAKETGIAQSQISMLKTGDRDIAKLSLKNADKLTSYGKQLKERLRAGI